MFGERLDLETVNEFLFDWSSTMTKALTVFFFLLGAFVALPSVAVAQEFTSPVDHDVFTTTANIAFTGINGTPNAWYVVEVTHKGVVQQSISIQADANGDWGGTLNAPTPRGWPRGQVWLAIKEGGTTKDSVNLTIQ